MEAGSAAGVRRPDAAFPCRPRARGTGLAARDQARRLSAHRPQGRPARPAVVAHGSGLAQRLHRHRFGRCGPSGDEPDDRRRGGCPPPGRNVRLPRAGVIESPRRLSDRLRHPPARWAGHAGVAFGGAARPPRGNPPRAHLGVVIFQRGRRGRRRATRSSGTPATWAWKGSSRNGRDRPTDPARRTLWRKIRCPNYTRPEEQKA